MCVGFGSFSGPPEAQGLAHFLEYMLFIGSIEFPDENEVYGILGSGDVSLPEATLVEIRDQQSFLELKLQLQTVLAIM
ncbi:hypothetical protein GOBAR_AA31562 [Gossypium barbadense]|uniref:Peptidase M16 N-terminal domain-containing protein n=1 Tax=Gossypium barbadense TaxID=3634 RepID=A0A2P5WDF6_GOSBA|nr:hypothetical protein GOBAR_AA31562 [Gossypium barbadense]